MKERLEEAKYELEVAQRQGQYEKASRLRFSTIPELEKKLPKENAATVAPTPPTIEEPPSGSVAAAAAALEKPKEKEKRISTMTEVQIMEKLRSVESADDPKVLYSKIKKIGQGYVHFPNILPNL